MIIWKAKFLNGQIPKLPHYEKKIKEKTKMTKFLPSMMINWKAKFLNDQIPKFQHSEKKI